MPCRNASSPSVGPGPDALDLLLICAESGTSMEQAFRRVSTGDRTRLDRACGRTRSHQIRRALPICPSAGRTYEHLAERTGLESVKAVSTALIQAERLAARPSVRPCACFAQESRDQRMNEGREEGGCPAAQADCPLMILFFLPVLFRRDHDSRAHSGLRLAVSRPRMAGGLPRQAWPFPSGFARSGP